MARNNFHQQKRQRELSRKERQSERLLRRGERPAEDASAGLVAPASPKPSAGGS